MPLVKIESALLNLIHLDPRVYFIFNLKTRTFEYANPAFYAFFNLTKASLEPERLLKMIKREERLRFEKTFCSLQPGVLQDKMEYGIKFPDGALRYIVLNLVLEKQEDQSLVSGFLEDITVAKALYLQEKERAADRELKRRALSHDLSGTLGFIPTFSNLILKKTESLDDKQLPVLLASIDNISKETLKKIKDYMNGEVS